jgi:hypothetical protein
MQTFEDSGYLNQFKDKNDTHNGVTVYVHWIASDGLTTYVKISYTGEFPKGEWDNSSGSESQDGSSSVFLFEEDKKFAMENGHGTLPDYTNFAAKNIKDATLSTASGENWSYAHQFMLGFTGEQDSVLRPLLTDKTLEDNEAIIIFYGTSLMNAATFSLEFEIRGMEEKFIINDMQCAVAPVETRDLRSKELIYHGAPLADMRLVSLKSSLLETIVTIEWDLSPDFSPALHFFSGQEIVFDWGEASASSFMFFPTVSPPSGDENTVIIRSHSIAASIPLNKEIKVSSFGTASQSTTSEMFIIPAE